MTAVFHDIFSRKPLRKKEVARVIVDNREKNSLVVAELMNKSAIITFEQLEVGDYIVNDVVVERKTLADLKASIIDKRIFEQLPLLKKYPKYILLIEDTHATKPFMHENALRGFFLSAALEIQVPIIYTKNEKDTADHLILLSRRNPPKKFSLRVGKNAPTKEEQQQFILEGFPGIGPAKAKLLLQKFKSIRNIITASPSELEGILGVNTIPFLALCD